LGYTYIEITPLQRVSFGDMVEVKLKPDITTSHSFTWSRGQVIIPPERERTQYFEYTEKADYLSLFIELENDTPPDEIGALINGVCKGATVYSGKLSEILLYLDEADLNEEIEIVFAYKSDAKSSGKQMNNFAVVNPKNQQLEYKPLIATAYTPYYHIRFTDGKDEVGEDITAPFVQLMQNYPNPFNPETTIDFYLSHDENVTLAIYNIKGQKVCDLLRGATPAGKHSVVWKGSDSLGNAVSSGIYFYRLTTKLGSVQRKMVLVK